MQWLKILTPSPQKSIISLFWDIANTRSRPQSILRGHLSGEPGYYFPFRSSPQMLIFQDLLHRPSLPRGHICIQALDQSSLTHWGRLWDDKRQASDLCTDRSLSTCFVENNRVLYLFWKRGRVLSLDSGLFSTAALTAKKVLRKRKYH